MNKQSYNRLLEKVTALKDDGIQQDLILSILKDEGVSIIDAIRINRVCFGLSLGESKIIVAHHTSWQAVSEAGDKLHQELIDSFKDITI